MEAAVAQESNVTPIAARGRKDLSGQEKVIEMDKLRDKVHHLSTLKRAAQEAAVEYGEAVKAVAESSGLQSSVIRTFINAVVSDKRDGPKREAEQLALCFDSIPA